MKTKEIKIQENFALKSGAIRPAKFSVPKILRAGGFLLPCPCGGIVEHKTEKVVQDGIDCGMLEVELCNKCGTKYLPEESMLVVEEKLICIRKVTGRL